MDLYDNRALEQIRNRLTGKKETLAVAESVTSGHLQAAFSLAEQATIFFQGGITAYNLNQKARILQVDAVDALSCNCVSEHVSMQMARHVAKLFQADWAISITGYASKIPEMNVNELFAFFSVVHHGEIVVSGKIHPKGSEGIQAQLSYTNIVLEKFSEAINSF